MKHYGLIGYPLSHSFSEKYFLNKFYVENIDADYKNIEIKDLQYLKSILKEKNIAGFNVTIPFKEQMMDMVDSLGENAQQIGAINCVKIKDNKLLGFNTDILGFEISLFGFLPKNINISALIFGNGGASKAVQFVLNKRQIDYKIVSRKKEENTILYEEIDEELLQQHSLLINTTPVGTFPNVNDCLPLPYQFICSKHFAFDMIYNPALSSFLEKCRAQNAQIKNGLEMLEIQAEESYKIFCS